MRRVAPRFGAPVRPPRVDFSALAMTNAKARQCTKPLDAKLDAVKKPDSYKLTQWRIFWS